MNCVLYLQGGIYSETVSHTGLTVRSNGSSNGQIVITIYVFHFDMLFSSEQRKKLNHTFVANKQCILADQENTAIINLSLQI